MATDQPVLRAGGWLAGWRTYALGLTALLLAAVLKLALDPVGDTRTATLALLAAVLAAAWYGGLLPGLAATLAAALVGDYLLVPASGSFTSGRPADALRLGVFLIEGSLISVLVGRLRGARPPPPTHTLALAEPGRVEPDATLAPDPETLSRLGLALAGQRDMEKLAADNALLYRQAETARAAAEAASGLKDEFLSTLSHELRTPLSAIVGWAHLLERGQLSPEETASAVGTIIRNATAQNQIIDALLDVSRIITGKLQLDLQPVDLAVVVKAALATVAPGAEAKGIRLQLIQDPAGSHVMGDPERLQQVLWNLFSNAIKFTAKNGRVRVSVESVGSNVEVVVADSGLGIAPDFLPRIFDRFTQDDSSSTRQARGLGLGLSIARQLVELHGGSIHAESPGLGQGSTFTARFPRSPVTAAPVARVYSQADKLVGLEPGTDLTGVRVLVVEDDDDGRRLVQKVLETQGASVKAAASAREALDLLATEPVDVLLSDIEMPGTDGYQLIKELRLRPAQQGGSVPAAALTAYARTEDRLRALRAGFQLHLAKPVQPSELVTVVSSLAARRS